MARRNVMQGIVRQHARSDMLVPGSTARARIRRETVNQEEKMCTGKTAWIRVFHAKTYLAVRGVGKGETKRKLSVSQV